MMRTNPGSSVVSFTQGCLEVSTSNGYDGKASLDVVECFRKGQITRWVGVFLSSEELREAAEVCLRAAEELDLIAGLPAMMATGAGKTPTAIAIMQALPGPTLAIAHRGELLDQAAEKMAAFGLVPELEKADAYASLRSSVVLASVPSLQNSRLERFPVDHFKFIWIDECKHAPVLFYRNILGRFPNAKVFGCTATLDRLDGEGYEEIFEKVSFEKPLSELIVEESSDEQCWAIYTASWGGWRPPHACAFHWPKKIHLP